jgi:hypothetical protein
VADAEKIRRQREIDEANKKEQEEAEALRKQVEEANKRLT